MSLSISTALPNAKQVSPLWGSRLQAREPNVCWDSSPLDPVVERYSARAGVGEALLTRGSTAAAPPAVMHLHQPGQASDPSVCATERPGHRLAPATPVLALGNSP